MIHIRKNTKADSRTCDVSKVTKQELDSASGEHITDVRMGIRFLIDYLESAGKLHDYDKHTRLDEFYSNFKTNFKKHSWLDNHYRISRHHLEVSEGIRDDVNLIDVLECIADCVMAGMARSGKVRPVEIDSKVLVKAVDNTVKLLAEKVKVEDDS